MVSFNSVQKIILLGVIVASVPVVSLNMLMPRLAIADNTKLTLKLIDITVENYTSGDTTGKSHTNTTTLDLWLQVGLPVKNNSLTSNDSLSKAVRSGLNKTWDTSYYNVDGSPNINNMKDPTENIFVPQINLTASYNGNVVGSGGTVKVYQLNSSHPVEYAHIYLNCSREADGGLMYMFSQLTANGGLDNLLLSMLGGSSSGDIASALLGGLTLSLTAFAGSAPLTLSLGTNFFTSELPGIPASSVAASSISAADAYPSIHYDHKMNLKEFGGTMKRFQDQLGLVGPILRTYFSVYLD